MELDRKIQRDVLIVDDDENIREILQIYCHNMQCFKNIVHATDGSAATLKLRNQKFSLILLDLSMPKKSGIDLLDEFDSKSLNQKENIIIVSGTLEKELIGRIIGHGINNFLVKPFNEATFRERVLKVLLTPTPVIPPSKP